MILPDEKSPPGGNASISLRFFVPLLLLCASGLSLAFLYWDSTANNQLSVERDNRKSMEILSAHLQDDLEYFLRERALDLVHAKFAELSAMPDIKLAALADESGKIIASTRLAKAGGRMDEQLAGTSYADDLERLKQAGWVSKEGESMVASDRRAVLTLFPVQMGIRGDKHMPEKTGSLFLLQDISFQLEAGRAENAEWLIRMAVLFGVLTLTVGLIMHFLVLRRIARLEFAAKQISAGDMRIIENLGRMDEIGRLGTSFNSMVRSLVASSGQVRKLSRAVEQAPVSTIITDSNGLIEYVNPHFVSTTGYSLAEVLGRPVSILKSGNTTAEEYAEMWRVIKAGENWRGEMQNKRKDGSLYWEQVLVGAVRDDKGEITHFLSVQEEITTRKEREIRLELFARIFDGIHEAVMVTDVRNNIVFVNPAFTGITGYAAGEVTVKAPGILSSGMIGKVSQREMQDSIDKSGHWQGEVTGQRKDGESYTAWLSISAMKNEYGAISHYIAVFSDISERKQVEARMAHMAQHDFLTDLPNRMLLQDRLEQAIIRAAKERRKVAVMFLNLDRFKIINEMLGHLTGDKLLQEVARRISSVDRVSATVSRQGSDEFIIMLPDMDESKEVEAIASRLMEAVSGPYLIDGNEVEVTTSIGISIFPENGLNGDTLIRNADAAMYYAKKNGRNNFQFFTGEMSRNASERMSVEKNLRHALERNEFCLHYQPQLDLRSGQIIGAEALIRWNHPFLGLVTPGQFIPIAEESGLIIQIGEWVLREACRQSMAWRKLGLPRIAISVNLSVVQFRQKNLGEMIMSILDECGLDPGSLDLEITESVIMQNPELAIILLQQLKQGGLQLSMDDFGTGYSSLSYLKRFPFDKLKIDQSFVRDLITDADDAEIVGTIISMARNLKLKVIAEGVETAGQLAFLKQHECDEMQGYYFSRPVDAEKFAALLASWPGGDIKPLPSAE